MNQFYDSMNKSGIQSGGFNLSQTNMARQNTFYTMQMFNEQNRNKWITFSNYDFPNRQKVKTAKSGITVIDKYFDQIKKNEGDEVDCLRQSTEFRRLISMIQSHWKAKRFPRCEQLHVNSVIQQLVEDAKTKAK